MKLDEEQEKALRQFIKSRKRDIEINWENFGDLKPLLRLIKEENALEASDEEMRAANEVIKTLKENDIYDTRSLKVMELAWMHCATRFSNE